MKREYPENIHLRQDGGAVVIVDQTALPGQTLHRELTAAEQMFEAIHSLRVRGAPAIGICAGFCLYVLARSVRAESTDAFLGELRRHADYLGSSRPTAVNLSWALNRMVRVAEQSREKSVPQLLNLLEEEAHAIQNEDIEMCAAIARHGLTLLKDGDGVLTHCNAGPLATSKYGTALGPLILAKERGIHLRVFADETRPLLQGARLTAYELHRARVECTLICDNMASIVMKNGWINACFVGCDRIAQNGDTANKIGTSGVAILAKHYGIPFYVLGPSSTVDLACETGADIEIELRDPEEIRSGFYREPMAPAQVPCYNPAFDVTDHALITGIVTEYGIISPPYKDNLPKILKQISSNS